MNDPFRMRRFEGLGDLQRKSQCIFDGQPTGFEFLLERLPFDELHREVLHTFVFVETVDYCYMGMIECGQQFRFALEPGQAFLIRRKR